MSNRPNPQGQSKRPASPSASQSVQKVVFLDRDGVINQAPSEGRYIESWAQFRFAHGALDMLRVLADKGYRLAVVTNQQGVGKGLVGLDAVQDIHRRMCAAAAVYGAEIDGVFLCPHLAAERCACRKPKPGLIHQALRTLGYPVDLANSWMIGDSATDIAAGTAAGLRTLLIGPPSHPAAAKASLAAADARAAAKCL